MSEGNRRGPDRLTSNGGRMGRGYGWLHASGRRNRCRPGRGVVVGLVMSIDTGDGKTVGDRFADLGESVWNGLKGLFS